jgi:hypothetical protein
MHLKVHKGESLILVTEVHCKLAFACLSSLTFPALHLKFLVDMKQSLCLFE